MKIFLLLFLLFQTLGAEVVIQELYSEDGILPLRELEKIQPVDNSPPPAPAVLPEAASAITVPVQILVIPPSGHDALWLPEKYLAARNTSIDVIISGVTYNVALRSSADILYVDFNSVFSKLGCTLQKGKDGIILTDNNKRSFNFNANGIIYGDGVEEKYPRFQGGDTFLPLVQTLRLIGYAAYCTQEKIYINPRIYEIGYKNSGVLIRANAKLQPGVLKQLDNPPRALIDMPYSAYDVSINILRVNDQHVSTVRAAQFDKGVVRIVMDLQNEHDRPVLSYTDGGRTMVLAFTQTKTDADTVHMPPTPALPPKTAVVPTPAVNTASAAQTVNYLKGLKVAVIAGHGGSDPGAPSKQGYVEKEITLEIAKRLRDALRAKGAVVFLNREEDKGMSLNDQAAFANNSKADVLISVHLNSFVNESTNGAESFYYKPIDFDLAKAVHEEIIKSTGQKNRGLRKAQLHNLNHTTMPGVLIEPLFMSNPKEAKLMKSPEFQQKIVQGIINGLEKYEQNKKSK
ncbi:hypothetical protein HP1_086 [Candidatus Termititenax spirochaetophilus]|uniref:MurNAc-LAA domain-containing protein n=1 Tax=Candidatus Termititenax spirochaetophilus TaxID=2218522 RepID=A0A388T8B5_9BACT|nr:hypothetical protein HP1_086 [Candidatus Termititenax spirochaetophilus]